MEWIARLHGIPVEEIVARMLPNQTPTNTMNIYMLFTGREVRMGKKNVPEVLSTARGRRPSAVLKTKGTVFFPIRTDLARYITCLFFFLQ